MEHFVNVSSIRIVSGIRREWTKMVMAPHFQRGTGVYADKWWSYHLEREAFNCGEEMSRREALIVYFVDDGTNWPGATTDYPTAWRPVAPDTVAEGEIKFVCAWKTK
jgi:hypothetical protein